MNLVRQELERYYYINFAELSRDADSYINTIALHDLNIGPLEIEDAHLGKQIEDLGQGQDDQVQILMQQRAVVQIQPANERATAIDEITNARDIFLARLNMCGEVDYRLRDMSQVRAAALLARYRAVNRIWRLARSATHHGWLVDEGRRLRIGIQVGREVGASAAGGVVVAGEYGAPPAAGGC